MVGSEWVQIPVGRNGEKTIVDAEDEHLAQWKWHLHRVRLNRYACRSVHTPGGTRHVMLHHHLLPRQRGMDVDHVDGDSLNNRRGNLRYIDHATNVLEGWNRRRARKRIE
jgi:hypothetical protein